MAELVYAAHLKRGDEIRISDGGVGTVHSVRLENHMCPMCTADTLQKVRVNLGEPGDLDDRHMIVDRGGVVERIREAPDQGEHDFPSPPHP